MKITFLVLAHNEPDSIIDTAKFVTSQGHNIIVHYDATAKESDLKKIQNAFLKLQGKAKILSEVQCGWGKWSLVEAPLRCLEEIKKLGWKPDYVHLMSAAEVFTKPVAYLENFLAQNSNFDFIESVDITRESWVQGGLEMERFEYYYPYSFIDERTQFDRAVALQRTLGIKRKIPNGLIPRMGSQWWTLRWSTCEKITNYLQKEPKLVKYFKSTWIPDESFFQTLVAHLVPEIEISQTQIVFHWLAPNGRPFVFKNGHEQLIADIPHPLIRKVSAEAKNLHKTLKEYRSPTKTALRIPSLEEFRQSALDFRSKLNSRCSFEHDATWSMKDPSFDDLHKYFVVITHAEIQTPDVARICAKLSDTVTYLKRPFSTDKKFRAKGFHAVSKDARFTDRSLIALLKSQGDTLPVASLVLGEDSLPDESQILHNPRCLTILLESESKIFRELCEKEFPQQYNTPAFSVPTNELANELKLLKFMQGHLKPELAQ